MPGEYSTPGKILQLEFFGPGCVLAANMSIIKKTQQPLNNALTRKKTT